MSELDPQPGEEPSNEVKFDVEEPMQRPYVPYFSTKKRWRKIKAPIEPEQQINQQEEQGNKGE